jgi:hypothetical protein
MQNYVSIRKPYICYSMYRNQTKNLMPEAVPISLSGLSLKIDIKEVAYVEQEIKCLLQFETTRNQ